MDINRSNYENFFLLYLDRELNEADRNTVDKFLNENTDLQKEFALLQKTIQWPADVLFEQKESLYRKEEKRRIIPVYWMRRVAAIALILAGSWFMTTRVVKNPGKEIAGAENAASTQASVKINQPQTNPPSENPTKQEKKEPAENRDQLSNQEIADRETGKPLGNPLLKNRNPDDHQTGQKSLTKNTGKTIYRINQEPPGQTAVQNQEQGLLNPEPEESFIAMQKSNAALELQNSMAVATTKEPGLIAALPKTETPALISVVAATDNQTGNKNFNQRDTQTDNAISVIALNDRNKAIAGFFKKLTRHAPDDEAVNNSKKLRVSVFQISY